MANHRAPRRSASRTGSTNGAHATPPSAAPVAGKRKAVKPSRLARTLPPSGQTPSCGSVSGAALVSAPRSRGGDGRRSLLQLLPSAPSAVGAVALVVAATGAVTLTQPNGGMVVADDPGLRPASAFSGVSAVTSRQEVDSRTIAVSRDSQRAALEDAADEKLQEAVEAQAQERNAALAQLAASAEKYAGQIAANAWQLPLTGYRLTARFGYSSSLWANTHTGLDFAASYGTPVVSVANGTVRSAAYDGSYGNKVVVALEDGTEIWYCHLSTMSVSPGDSVVGGEQVGAVGSTGNSTGSHLHLEVRPGAGDPVDPYAALVARGLNP